MKPVKRFLLIWGESALDLLKESDSTSILVECSKDVNNAKWYGVFYLWTICIKLWRKYGSQRSIMDSHHLDCTWGIKCEMHFKCTKVAYIVRMIVLYQVLKALSQMHDKLLLLCGKKKKTVNKCSPEFCNKHLTTAVQIQ